MATAKKDVSTEVAVRETADLVSAAIPDFMKEDKLAFSNAGTEELSNDDITIPRLAIAQDTHDEIKNPAKRLRGLATGDFFNVLTKEIYKQGEDGAGPLLVTVLFARKNRRYFTPRTEGSKTLCVSANGTDGGSLAKLCAQCQHSNFTRDKETGAPIKPKCTLFYNYILIIHHKDGRSFTPLMFSLKGQMTRGAKDWNSSLRTGMAPFAKLYNISTFYDNSSAAGGFYNLKVEPAGLNGNEEAYRNAKALFQAMEEKVGDIISKGQQEEQVHEAEVVDDDEDTPF